MHTILERILMALCALSFALAALGWWAALRLATERPTTRRMRLEAASAYRLSERRDMRLLATYTPEG